jgi:hypothetical protein
MAALEKAVADRNPPPGVVHHSDREVQYASGPYVDLLRKHGMIPSMSRPTNPYDNASCESFIKTLKREEIYANSYRDLDHLRANIAEFIDHYYNRVRLHSALGYLPPEEFEQSIAPSATSQGAKMSFFRHQEIFQSDGGSTGKGEPAIVESMTGFGGSFEPAIDRIPGDSLDASNGGLVQAFDAEGGNLAEGRATMLESMVRRRSAHAEGLAASLAPVSTTPPPFRPVEAVADDPSGSGLSQQWAFPVCAAETLHCSWTGRQQGWSPRN